jgi:hypothetical protein
MPLLAGGAFEAETIENPDMFATDADDSGFAQFAQGRSHGFAIDAQMLGDLLMRQVLYALSLRSLKYQAGDARHQLPKRCGFEVEKHPDKAVAD